MDGYFHTTNYILFDQNNEKGCENSRGNVSLKGQWQRKFLLDISILLDDAQLLWAPLYKILSPPVNNKDEKVFTGLAMVVYLSGHKHQNICIFERLCNVLFIFCIRLRIPKQKYSQI